MPNENNDPTLPISELGPAEAYNGARKQENVSPADPGSMPRAEDDEDTYARSPEFHDREDADRSGK